MPRMEPLKDSINSSTDACTREARLCGNGHSNGCNENCDRWENESVPPARCNAQRNVRTCGPANHHLHKGEGTLKLHSFLLCGNTPDDREQGVQVLKPSVVVPLSRRLPHRIPHTQVYDSAKRESPWKSR